MTPIETVEEFNCGDNVVSPKTENDNNIDNDTE